MLAEKLKVTAVSYLNTKPLLYGLLHHPVQSEIDLQLDIPSVCAQRLRDGDADLGLIPVAAIPELEQPYIISDYCIGATGVVKTVAIFSEVPIEEMTHLYLDYHSRTSVQLAQVLLREYWQVQPELIQATPGFEREIGGTKGAVIIGDRTMGLDDQFAYVYDLGAAWKAHTGLPFVFAAWVSTRPLDPAFIERFNAALRQGIEHIPQLMFLLPDRHPNFDLRAYFTKNISYQLDRAKKQALYLFLSKLGNTALQSSILESLAIPA
ncbi:MAG: menaquinone biosynthesis protein [Phaeodactylibacter sp.]|nr:menaquinone biosynthesis protein [Phaeodactylibacter sp.]